MQHPKGHHPGATWRKSDLQCHTARDHSWADATQLPGGTEAHENARDTWADSFIAACNQKGVSVIAVTDHHDICIAPYVQRAAERDGNRVLVYPGLEVTCSDNAQCLTIIEPTASEELKNRFIAIKGGVAAAKHAPRTPQCLPSGLSVEAFFEFILSDDDLRENSVILPHFSDGTAHKHLNIPGNHTLFSKLDCDGVYIEKHHASLETDTLKKILGNEADWGKRRRAVVATGDNRNDDWRRLGAHNCWLKLGENSIEALRQALLADEARITFERPSLPNERIVSLTFQSKLTEGQAFSLTFNEGFNAIIGGRGSGKSSILEYLRFGIARTVADFKDGEVPSSGGKEQTLIEETLATGFVEVVIERDQVREKWRREWRTRDKIVVTDSAGSVTELSIDEAQRKFRGRAFYQKGLSSTVNDPTNAADQITGIAAAEVLEKRRTLEQQIENAQRGVRTALGNVAAHWQNCVQHRHAIKQAEDIKLRVLAVNDRLDKEGVSAETKKVLEQAPIYSRAKAYLDETANSIATTKTLIGSLQSQIIVTKTEISLVSPVFDEIARLESEVNSSISIISKLMDEALKELATLTSKRENAFHSYEARYTSFAVQHGAAMEAQSSHSFLIDESSKLSRESEEAQVKVSSAALAEQSSTLSLQKLTSAQDELTKLVAARRVLLQDATAHVAGKSSERLEAKVKNDPCPTQYIDALCKLFISSYVSEPEAKCRLWIEKRIKTDAVAAWADIRRDVLQMYQQKIMHGRPPEPSDELAVKIANSLLGEAKITPAQAKKIYQNLSDATVGDILAAVPRDFIHMRYIDDQRRAKPFEKASQGQQASALLELLLQQSAGTLIIDQPEDDLDNRVVMKIVDLIRISKSKRQLIFTTHNPNIVVNGDADKVIALGANDTPPNPSAPTAEITLDVDGSIETKDIRTVITKIMEGGVDAFELRRRKYRFDKEG